MIIDADTAGRAHARLLTDADVEGIYEAWSALPADAPLREVNDLIGDLSEGMFWAGWLNGIDEELWRVLHTEPKHWPEGRDSREENLAGMQRLMALTIEDPEGPWWFIDDLEHTALGLCVARKAPLAECEAHFEKMQGRAAKAPYVITPPAKH